MLPQRGLQELSPAVSAMHICHVINTAYPIYDVGSVPPAVQRAEAASGCEESPSPVGPTDSRCTSPLALGAFKL